MGRLYQTGGVRGHPQARHGQGADRASAAAALVSAAGSLYGVTMQMDGTPGQPTPIDAALLMMRMLFAALMGSVVIYVVIIHIIARGEPTEVEQTLSIGLAGAAVALGLLAPFARRLLMPRKDPGRPEEPAPSTLSPRGFGRTFAAHVVAWMMCEAVAVMGVVLAFAGREPSAIFPFAGGAVLLFLFLAPRRAELEAVARAESSGAGG